MQGIVVSRSKTYYANMYSLSTDTEVYIPYQKMYHVFSENVLDIENKIYYH